MRELLNRPRRDRSPTARVSGYSGRPTTHCLSDFGLLTKSLSKLDRSVRRYVRVRGTSVSPPTPRSSHHFPGMSCSKKSSPMCHVTLTVIGTWGSRTDTRDECIPLNPVPRIVETLAKKSDNLSLLFGKEYVNTSNFYYTGRVLPKSYLQLNEKVGRVGLHH